MASSAPATAPSRGLLGGVFRDAYDKLQLTTSTAMTAYSEFPAKDSPPKMWTGPEYLEYLQD